MPITIRRTLRIYTTILVALPLCVSAAVFYFFMRENSIHDAYERMTWETTTLSNSLEMWSNDRIGDIEHVALSASLTKNETDGIAWILKSFVNSHRDFTSIVLIDSMGNITLGSEPDMHAYIGDRNYFIRAMKGTPTISQVLQSRLTGKPILVIAHPVRDVQERIYGVVAGVVNIDTLFRMFAISDKRNPWSPFLLAADSRTLLQDMGKGQPFAVPQDAGGGSSPPIYTNNNGVLVVGSSQLLKNDQWLLVREKPMAEILGGMHQILLTLAAASLTSLLILRPLLMRLSASITRPVQAISEMSTHMLTGEHNQTCPAIDTRQTPEELATLYGNFCQMADRISSYVHELEVYTSTDALTGLGNRRSLDEEGTRIVESCSRANSECACLVLDIDHFKKINDTYGHQTGDIALRNIAETIRKNARKADFTARMGGEEFAIISANTTLEQALVLAERVRADVERAVVTHKGNSFSMTISIGVAPLSDGCAFGTTLLENMIGKADCALYKAKANGRNRVETWQDADADTAAACNRHA
ncbi:sensor domain-containing diguanylate cyclase [Nitratidesulfovibrio termitidis]|uniref:sensor domain-containing diguanylate cyclase n=1 Tax=Nitratidesulfovibrio termitidis TaxID=42252 RepID=UPI0003FD3B4A|nr:diguanylate cyclase [Nitratidesulfovibrio termitidis]